MPVDATIPDPSSASDPTWKADHLDPWIADVSGTIATLEAGGSAYAGTAFEVWVDDYGAVGDGTTDDSDAFAAAYADAVAAQVVVAGDLPSGRKGGIVIRLGAGQYRITEANAMMGQTAATGLTYGITYRGMGRGITEVVFDPAASAYLCTNDDDWMGVTFEGITFRGGSGTNAKFMLSNRGSNAIQHFAYRDCDWFDDWDVIFNLTGTDNNSEWLFERCQASGDFTTFLDSTSSDAFVNFTFFDCQIHYNTGDFLKFTKGGNINLFGSSLICWTSGTFFKLLGTSHNAGATYFRMYGGRAEMHTSSVKLIESEWLYGNIVIDSVDTAAMAPIVGSWVTATWNIGGESGPLISVRDCSIQGQHEVIYGDTVLNYAPNITYERCTFWDYAKANDAFVFTAAGGHTNEGGLPVVRIRSCRGSDIEEVWDADLNWYRHMRGHTERKIRVFNNWLGGNPQFGETTDIKLPVGAIVIGARMVSTIALGNASQTLTFQTSEGTPTVLLQKTDLSAAFDVGSTTLFHRCTSDATRTINLVASGSVSGQDDGFVGYIEYIG